MRLAEPTDFEILQALSDGRRNNAANVARMIDKNRSYINTRFPILRDYGLVERVGPSPNSGLYEITDKGRVVLELRDDYRSEDIDFEERVEERLADRR
ncbi:MAG: ArsR family transcriptional regulator [Natronomonas sp.]